MPIEITKSFEKPSLETLFAGQTFTTFKGSVMYMKVTVRNLTPPSGSIFAVNMSNGVISSFKSTTKITPCPCVIRETT